MQVAPENAVIIPQMEVMDEIKGFSGPFACTLYLISCLLFSFSNNTAALAFGGLFFALALIITVAKLAVMFFFPNNTLLPRTVSKQKTQLITIVAALLANMLAAIRSSSESESLKTLEVLSFIVSLWATLYLAIALSKEQLATKIRQQARPGRPEVRAPQQVMFPQEVRVPVDCSICIFVIRAVDRYIRLACGHKFHDACFQGWNPRRCPNCNGPY